MGTGYTDAKYPGVQAVTEKLARFWVSYQSGRVNYPVGLVNVGKAFSAEQALVDLEVARWIHEFGKGVAVNADTLCVESIRQQGIGGNFLTADHTVANMCKAVWYPTLMDRSLATGSGREGERDMLERAHNLRYKQILASADYEIDRDGRRAIEDIEHRAKKVLAA